LRIIGKETQKKIDLQIESLQKKVADLQTQLAEAKAEHKKLDASAAKAQADAAKGKEVIKFFDWAFKNGGTAATELDYVPLPAAVVKQVQIALEVNPNELPDFQDFFEEITKQVSETVFPRLCKLFG
jgi:hypothetical protein